MFKSEVKETEKKSKWYYRLMILGVIITSKILIHGFIGILKYIQ